MSTTVQVQVRNRAQRRAQGTRARLLEAARVRFSEKGLDATTVEDITELADVGKGTFYRHFSCKAQVLEALVDEAIGLLGARLSQAAGKPAALEEALEHLVACHASFFCQEYQAFNLLFQGQLMQKVLQDPDGDQPLRRYLDAIAAQLQPFVPGPADEQRVRRLASALAEFVSGWFSFAAIGMAPAQIEQVFAPVRRVFVTTAAAFLLESRSATPTEPMSFGQSADH